MDRITRKELKTDHFVEGFEDVVEYLSEHRTQIIRYGSVALVIAAVAAGFYYYRKNARIERQQALYSVREVETYPVSAAGEGTPGTRVFRSEKEKRDYLIKAYTELANKYPGSQEACIAEFSIGTEYASGQMYPQAQKQLETAAACGDANVASLANLSLSQVLFAEGKPAQGEKLLRELMEHPTPMVTKGQAIITLARMLAPDKPAEARKLLDPLRTSGDAAGRAALVLLSELQQND